MTLLPDKLIVTYGPLPIITFSKKVVRWKDVNELAIFTVTNRMTAPGHVLRAGMYGGFIVQHQLSIDTTEFDQLVYLEEVITSYYEYQAGK